MKKSNNLRQLNWSALSQLAAYCCFIDHQQQRKLGCANKASGWAVSYPLEAVKCCRLQVCLLPRFTLCHKHIYYSYRKLFFVCLYERFCLFVPYDVKWENFHKTQMPSNALGYLYQLNFLITNTSVCYYFRVVWWFMLVWTSCFILVIK